MKIEKIISAAIVLFLCCATSVLAQQVGFTYQAVAIDESKAQGFGRDSRGEILVNKAISLRFSIREGTEDGEIKYQEIHHTSTDIFGIFRLVIGRGLNATGTDLKELQWGEIAYFLQVEIDLGNGFEFMGVEELLGVPYALNTGKQLLSLDQNELSISNGNSVTLSDNDPTNELITGLSIEGTNLRISDAGGTKSVDLKDVAGGTLNEAEVDAFVSNNGYLTNEIQDLQLNAHILSLTNINGGTQIDLSPYLDDTNLSESEVDTYVSNNGYLTSEIQNLQLIGNILSITNNNAATQIDLSPYLDDTNLTESEVDAFVNNNGYLTHEVDGSVTNEIQNISTDGAAGNISISNGATLNLNVNDADASPTNEIQDLNLTGNTLSITSNTNATQIDLTSYQNIFERTNSIISNENGDYDTDDFVFGGSDLNSNGTKFFFDKSKNAFRIGQATDNSWSDVNIGIGSFGFGYNNIASGFGAVTFGSGNQATGDNSKAFGHGNVITGYNSFTSGMWNTVNAYVSTAIGYTLTIDASAQRAIAMGSNNTVSGWGGVVIGSRLLSRSTNEITLGYGNTDVTPSSNTLWIPTDRLLVIGNATPLIFNDLTLPPNRSDALVMLKNGNTRLHGQLTIDADNVTGVGGSYTFPGQRGTNGQVMVTNGTGVLSWSTLPSTAFTTAAGVTSNAPGNYATDDFVFGSPQLADDGDVTHDSRMFFDKSKGAFRAGRVTGTQWNDASVGVNSIALGLDNVASGSEAVTIGFFNSASAGQSFAFGGGNTITNTGVAAIAIGTTNTVLGQFSRAIGHTNGVSSGGTAIGSGNNAANFGVAIGSSNTVDDTGIAIGNNSSSDGGIALGYDAITDNGIAIGESCESSTNGTALGFFNQAVGNLSQAFGHNNIVRSYAETSIGLYATDVNPPASAAVWNATDRLFVIGNGTAPITRSNALVMLKNGNTRLHGQLTIDADNVSGTGQGYTLPGQDGAVGNILVTDGAGIASWSNTINGDLTVQGVFSNPSDRRLKRNITPLQNSLSRLSQINGVNYNWKSNSHQDTIAIQTGVIAQELEAIFPELVKTTEDGIKSVNYIGLVPHLIEAVKELKTENEILKTENEKVKAESNAKLSAIESRLTQLEKVIGGNKNDKLQTKTE